MTPAHLPIPPSLPHAAGGTRDQLVDALAALGSLREEHGGAPAIRIPAGSLEQATQAAAGTPGARLADMFAADGDSTVLRLVWACEADQPGYVVTETEIDGDQYPPLSGIAPAAFVEECEIYEQFGIRPADGKPLNRVMLPPHDGAELPTLGHRPAHPPAEVHAPHVVGGQAFEFPFGPVRQVGVESLYYGLVTSGEEVVDLYLFTWHKHRGVEWRLRGKTVREAIFLAERAEGLSAVAVGWAFAAAAEAAADVTPPPAAARTRAVALELERLYNHAAATAALCQATGLSVGQAAAEIALERLLRVNAAAFGHRYLFGVVEPGGAGRAPDSEVLRRELPGAYDELRRTADALLNTNSFVDRLEACGILTAEQARRLGLVGPVARATGLATDTRQMTGAIHGDAHQRGHRDQRRRVRPLPGDAGRGGRVGPADRALPGRWQRRGVRPASRRRGHRPGLGRVAARRDAGLGGAGRRRADHPGPAAAGLGTELARVRRRVPVPERVHRHPHHRGQLLADRRGHGPVKEGGQDATVVRARAAPRRGHDEIPGPSGSVGRVAADAARVPAAAADPGDRGPHDRGLPRPRAEPDGRHPGLRRRCLHRLRPVHPGGAARGDAERRIRARRDHPAGADQADPDPRGQAMKPGQDEAATAEELRKQITAQFGRSLHIRTLDTGSCAVCEQEIRLLTAPHYDLHRLGFFFTPAPRHADLLLVTGPMVRAFEVAVRKTYEAMPGPKVVVATGACALGGVYQADPFVHGEVDAVLPVDVWIPGCPPSPLALLQGLGVAVGRLAAKTPGLTFIADEDGDGR